MSDYSQPEFYSFSQDSVELAKYVLSKTASMKLQSLLDLGCGCGVVGIEILKVINNEVELDAIDSEIKWEEYFLTNCRSMIQQHKFHFHHMSFHDFSPKQKYDCIVSNPPYFDRGAGRPNPNPLTDKARRWSENERSEFLKLFRFLKPQGIGFFLGRESVEFWEALAGKEKINLKISEGGQVAGAQVIIVTSFE